MKKWFMEKILCSNKKNLLFIGGCAFFVLFVTQILLLCNNTYFNSNSDDVAQYAVILRQYIENFKSGNFSWFNFNKASFTSKISSFIGLKPLMVLPFSVSS